MVPDFSDASRSSFDSSAQSAAKRGLPRKASSRGQGASMSMIFEMRPDVDLMAAAPWGFKIHAVLAFLLFAMWPFTRLVHVFSAPVGYLNRPYVVYRSRDARARGPQVRTPQGTWDKPGVKN